MFTKLILIVWFIIQNENVFGQVCVETKMNWRDVPETYLYTYLEAYEKTNCLFWCTDTRVATAVGTRTVRKQVAEQTNVCCDGYVVEESYNDNSLHCKPICSPPCVNGYCKSPGVCSCHPGYLPDIFDRHTCIPLCLNGCEHGTCISPNTCECDPGYEYDNDICEPICHEPCENGTCVAPDTCQCLPGYKKFYGDTCEPYCSSYTADGECVNTITCEPGWAKVIQGSDEICQPVCHEPCVNSTCTAPETCECLNGYIKSTMDTCEPYCESGCLHGSCISPDVCVCDPGWFKKKADGACLAHCDHVCGNGTCIAPDVCECFPGYILDESKLQEHERSLCVPVCENCEVPCTNLDECTCPWPQIPMHLTSTGLNCTKMEDKCERVLCYMTTTTMNSHDVAVESNTELTEPAVITTTTVNYETTEDTKTNDSYELKIDQASWFNSSWVYGIGALILLTILIVIGAGILKRKFNKMFETNKFNPNGEDGSAAVHYKQTSMS